MSPQNKEVFMKVTSNNGSTGYSWIVDDDCDQIVDIESGYVYYEPDTNDSWDVGYGEEIFTLTAKKYGECTFKIAYARAWEWTNFADFEETNGYIIQVPIYVLSGSNTNGGSGGSNTGGNGRTKPRYEQRDQTYYCDDTKENCALKEQLGIGWREERAFKIVGIQAWIRSILGINPIGHLPLSIAYVGANQDDAKPEWIKFYMWSLKWWT